jgi:hypothetical protein
MCYHAVALVRDRQTVPDFLATFWRLGHLYCCTQRMAYLKYSKTIPFAGISNIGNCHGASVNCRCLNDDANPEVSRGNIQLGRHDQKAIPSLHAEHH